MRAFLFPGQGSQKVGMDKGLPRRRFDEADTALGFALSKIIAEGPEAELQRTANAQPAILTVSMAWADVLTAAGITAEVVLGHSLGEYSALVYAGALDFADAVRLVHLRGRAMQAAVPEGVGAMAAIVGLEARSVADSCREASPDGSDACQPANFNGAGQVVISGHQGAVARAMALCKAKGAKLVKALPVSAPFHSALMAPAAVELEAAMAQLTFSDARIPVVHNVTAEANRQGRHIAGLLAAQVTGSVRWEESVRHLAQWAEGEASPLEVYEVGPGNVLAGLHKRILPTVPLRPLPSLPEGVAS